MVLLLIQYYIKKSKETIAIASIIIHHLTSKPPDNIANVFSIFKYSTPSIYQLTTYPEYYNIILWKHASLTHYHTRV